MTKFIDMVVINNVKKLSTTAHVRNFPFCLETND